MLRISSLLRTKRASHKLPMRAGLPGWSRPDPPTSANLPVDHELSDQQILFHFPDKSMPEFFLTQPEIYQGDTFREGAKNFFSGWGIFFLSATFIGGAMFFGLPSHKDAFYGRQLVQFYEIDKEMANNKQWLKWGKQNPMGIELSGEFFPQNYQSAQRQAIVRAKQSYDNITKPNNQIKSYLTKLKAKCDEKIRVQHSGQEHHSDSEHAQKNESH